MAGDFLLEIGVEEMPARFLNPALEQLKELAVSSFNENRIKFADIKTMGTPRRMVLYVRELAERQKSLEQEVKGPAVKVAFKDGHPTRAAEGFAKSQGVTVDELVKKPVGHVDYVFAVKREEGRLTEELLGDLTPNLVTGLHFPKPMRWGDLEFRFARPIRWLVALYGDRVIPFELAGLESGRVTYGHRFLSRNWVSINRPADYMGVMKENYVLVELGERRESIRRQIDELAREVGGIVTEDKELLEEVNNLVEYPTALCGSFDPAYLNLPPEVLVTPMREHQRYFPVREASGRLLAKFIAVSNGGKKHLDLVRAGNEKVLKARLEDAAFFWQEDMKTALASRVGALKKVVFQESLGTVYHKVQRVSRLADYLIKAMGGDKEDISVTERAALLAKADLVTNMVYEFPELQGIMGREYALHQGEKPAVAKAVYEHYLPRHAGDELPVSLPGKALSLADKMDTLTGCFGIGIQPTGSQDPYALRRQALGICHVIMDYGPGLSLRDMVHQAYEDLNRELELQQTEEDIQTDLREFFRQRLRGLFGEAGLRYDTVEAVLSTGFDDIADAFARGKAVEEFRRDAAFDAVLTAFTRASNLSKKAGAGEVREELMEEAAEKKLLKTLQELEREVKTVMAEQDYSGALVKIARLQGPVDDFFEQIMVMVDDRQVRDNRLILLQRITGLITSVADFSKIVVEKENGR